MWLVYTVDIECDYCNRFVNNPDRFAATAFILFNYCFVTARVDLNEASLREKERD